MSNLDPSRNYTFLIIAAFFGFLGFMIQPTAYTWGEQDMMPFFERILNPDYLTNDFFTNSTVEKNPRWVYGYFVVAISKITSLSWYNTLYVLKLLFLTLTPILYFKVLIVIIRKYVDKLTLSWISIFVLFCLIIMVYVKEYRYYFSVASWWSYTPDIHAHKVSVVLCFVGILLKEKGRKAIFYLPFFFLSCLVHPVIGLFSIVFYAICIAPELKKGFLRFFPILITSLAALLIVKFVFASDQILQTSEFIDIYVKERHPWHYSVPDFRNIKGNWINIFLFNNLLFSLPLIYGLIKKHRNLVLIASLSWVFYFGAIAMQYIFIELFPLKLVAYVGFSRFTSFGYWMLVVLWAMVLSNLLKSSRTFFPPSISQKHFTVFLIYMIFVGVLLIDNPKKTYFSNKLDYYNFIYQTPKDAIFMTYSSTLNTDMRLIGQRGVFISAEFPFTEEFISEYGIRYNMMYGSRKNEIHDKEFYRNLKPIDFYNISKKYQLDYILIENSFRSNFNQNDPVWKNNRHSLYQVETLKF